jgi:hypothetical protein
MQRLRTLYPHLPNYLAAKAYFDSIPNARGHIDRQVRPLHTSRRLDSAWRIKLNLDCIECMHWTTPVITYYSSGGVRITPTTEASSDLAVIRAVAPVDTVKWDYRKNCLVIRAGGKKYECGYEGVLIPTP